MNRQFIETEENYLVVSHGVIYMIDFYGGIWHITKFGVTGMSIVAHGQNNAI